MATVSVRIEPLLDVDPDLGERLSPGERQEARRLLRARIVPLEGGLVSNVVHDCARASLRGLLLVDGLVSRSVALPGATAVELLGRGDLIEPSPDAEELAGRLVPIDVRWTVLEPARVVVVDDELLHDAGRWAPLLAALFERVTSQATRMATRCAISQMARAEERVQTLLWFLAERWGRVGGEGVVLPLRLTHELLGQMLGAQRPTVSLALRELERNGLIRRREDGTWLLPVPPGETARLAAVPGGGVRREPGLVRRRR